MSVSTTVSAKPSEFSAAPPASIAVPRDRKVLSRLRQLAERVVASGRESIVVVSPFDGAPVGTVPRSHARDVETAFAKARPAQEDWALRDFAERGRVFLAFHDRLLARQDEILDLIQLESGKSRKHAFEEVVDAAIVARYYALHAEEHLGPKSRRGALPGLTQTWEHHHPKGVVGIIAPWNYPLSMGITDAIPALLAGNAVVEKPDIQTPFSTLWALDLLEDCGLPAGLMQVVVGDGPELGAPLLAGADYVQFTGSTATGKLIAKQAAERLVGCSLELGGKNPMIVLGDADLDAAVEGALRGCFASAGQLCISIERLFVHERIADEFLARFVRRAKALRLGAALDWTIDIGSLVSEKQLARVEAHVADAVARGARIEAGGRRRPDLGPLFYEPTILSGVTPAMACSAEETFGPVVSIYRFDSVNDVIERANASRYGLNASIWTRNTENGRRIATRLQCGTVNINEAYAAAWASVDAPMGGFKESGLGRRHGAEGILKFTESQTVSVQRGFPIAAPAGVPDEVFSRWLSQALKALRRFPGLR